VAANPVAGPLEVIGDSGAGVLDANLGRAALAALSISRELARARALTFTLSESARQFVDNVFAAHWVAAMGISSQAPFETRNLSSSPSEIGEAPRLKRYRNLGETTEAIPAGLIFVRPIAVGNEREHAKYNQEQENRPQRPCKPY
jgi:hypothetical protein